MREFFPGHYRPSEAEYRTLWERATIVFDTNVLLECYALPEQAREELLAVLEKIKDRIWMPYQVALEFHRRRFSKLREASKGISELRKEIGSGSSKLRSQIERMDFDKWNTGITDVPEILDQLKQVYQKLDSALEAAARKLPVISLEDPIAARLAALFTNRVGSPPSSQTELDALCKEGAQRYQADIPPGFSDNKKDDRFSDRGLQYEARYGDLILWKQLLKHATEQRLTHVIFVTADTKDDWWYSEKGERLGPQPALVEEFLRETQAEGFWIYTPDSFLEQARGEFAVDVADKTVEQVKQVAQGTGAFWQELMNDLDSTHAGRFGFGSIFKDAAPLSFAERRLLRSWVQDRHPTAALTAGLGIDIAAEENDEVVAAYHVVHSRRLVTLGAKIAALQLFPEVPHHVIVVLAEEAVPSFVFGSDTQSLFAQIRGVMQMKGILSTSFIQLEGDELLLLGACAI